LYILIPGWPFAVFPGENITDKVLNESEPSVADHSELVPDKCCRLTSDTKHVLQVQMKETGCRLSLSRFVGGSLRSNGQSHKATAGADGGGEDTRRVATPDFPPGLGGGALLRISGSMTYKKHLSPTLAFRPSTPRPHLFVLAP
jgi:hypothetical protein